MTSQQCKGAFLHDNGVGFGGEIERARKHGHWAQRKRHALQVLVTDCTVADSVILCTFRLVSSHVAGDTS